MRYLGGFPHGGTIEGFPCTKIFRIAKLIECVLSIEHVERGAVVLADYHCTARCFWEVTTCLTE